MLAGIVTALTFYLEVSKSILREVQCCALTHLKNGLANVLNKTAVQSVIAFYFPRLIILIP